jgi:hypothetical protein
VVALVALSAAAGAAAAPAVTDVAVSGPAVVESGDGTVVVASWRPANVTATVTASAAADDSAVAAACLGTAEAPGLVDCTNVTDRPGNRSVTLAAASWPTDVEDGALSVSAVDANGTVLASAPLDVRVLAPGGDADDDGLSNRADVERGTGPLTPDADGDGLPDGREVNVYGTDPTANDTDDDGLTDGVEVDEYGTDPTAVDTDDDGAADGREVTALGTDPAAADTDGDGLLDGAEVDEYGTDPTAVDTDDDGAADGREVRVLDTDPTAADTDGDRLPDGAEATRWETNPTVADTDGDGLSDGAEVVDHGTDPLRTDTDGDGRSDGAEVAAGTDPAGGALLPAAWRPGGDPAGPAVAGGAVVLVAAAVIAARRLRVRERLRSAGGDGATGGEDGAGREVTGAVPSAGGTEPVDAPLELDDAEAVEGRGAPAPDRTPMPDDDAAALADDERVLRLLAASDGRLRQSAVVERTGWSKSKTSRLLSRMSDDGRVEKVDIGRENLIALPEAVPRAARSTLDPHPGSESGSDAGSGPSVGGADADGGGSEPGPASDSDRERGRPPN